MKLAKYYLPFLIALTAACAGAPDDTPDGDDGTTGGKSDEASERTMCAAVRGNGELIAAHYGALARLVEHYGPFHAMAGGSSASITTFLTESMQMNPLVQTCKGERCTEAESRARLALLLKSFQGYIEVLGQSDEAAAVQAALPIVARVQQAGLEAVLAEDPAAAATALADLLEQDDLIALVNPELIAVLRESPDPGVHAADLLAAIKGFGAFQADDLRILLRPGVLNFPALADQIGVAASFYAGYGDFPTSRMEAWFDACAPAAVGKNWSEVRALPAGESACGPEFYAMLGTYRAAFDPATSPSRADDEVGASLPALISTSVLTGEARTAWEAAKAQYDGAEEPSLAVDFADVRFGYWGDADSLAALSASERSDLKSQKAISLGQATWRQALSLSPAEPGLARALPIDAARVSAGGWSDLHPVLVLKDIGCDEVVYVTRTDAESNFAQGVARLLGMDDAAARALYDLTNPESSFAQSLAEADAVLCTNWNTFEGVQYEQLAADAYAAPLQTSDPFFTDAGSPHPNITADTGLLGCTVPR